MKKTFYLVLLLLFGSSIHGQNTLTNALFNLKKGNLNEAKKLIDEATQDELFKDKAATWYYSGFIYKDQFKLAENKTKRNQLRIISRDHFYYCLEIEPEGKFSTSAKKALQYLAATSYNDAINASEDFKVAEQYFKFFNEIKTTLKDSTYSAKYEVDFFTAIANSNRAKAIEDSSKREAYTKIALDFYEKVLALDSNNAVAKYNVNGLKYNSLFLEYINEKEKRRASEIKLAGSLAQLDSVRIEYNTEKEILDSVKSSITVLMESISSRNQELEKTQSDLKVQKSTLKKAEMDLKAVESNLESSRENVSLTLSLLENQKSINSAIIAVAIVVLILLFIAIRGFVKQKKQNAIIEEQKTKVEVAHQEITDSIAYAKRIQSAILPPQKLVKEYLPESFILYKPKDVVAGDFYWMETHGNTILFAAADCTGHGVPGAMVSVVCNNGLNRSVREYGLTDPGKILDKTREIVIQEFEKSEEEVSDGMDIALCSLKGNTLHYAGAHNPLWIIRKGATEVEEIKANKQPIGRFDRLLPYTTHQVELNPGDSIYLFSDGFVDQFGGEKGKKLKAPNFRKLLLSMQDKPLEKQRETLDAEFERWRGDLEQIDDVCVIGVRV